MLDIIIQIISAFFGTLAFGLVFNIRGKKLLLVSLGGMCAWGLFLLLGIFIESEPLRYLIVAIFSTAYSEILARLLKTPATTFCIVTLISLVPGSALYYTTTNALSGNLDGFLSHFIYTAELAIALSIGIIITTSLFRHFPKRRG